jgi:urease accessory protein
MKRVVADSAVDPRDSPLADDPDTSSGRWQARLSLGFANDAGTSRMFERSHFGPLRVQKPLYPEGSGICHAIVVHPPGGVVGGDELAITAAVGSGAKAFITTPGAAKWYRANGRISRQDIRLEIGDDASLEWLPQETIFFNAAHVELNNTIALGKNALYIGCEILCFGRTASGESFDAGRIEQSTSIRQEGKLIWFEQGALSGDDSSMSSPLAMAGKTVFATLVAVGKAIPPTLISTIRADAAPIMDSADMFGATQLKSVFVVRYLGNSSAVAKQLMTRSWQRLRPEFLGRDAVAPRIWNT